MSPPRSPPDEAQPPGPPIADAEPRPLPLEEPVSLAALQFAIASAVQEALARLQGVRLPPPLHNEPTPTPKARE